MELEQKTSDFCGEPQKEREVDRELSLMKSVESQISYLQRNSNQMLDDILSLRDAIDGDPKPREIIESEKPNGEKRFETMIRMTQLISDHIINTMSIIEKIKEDVQ